MGLFSKLRKNKQEGAGQDSGYYSRADDQAATERARSKRASTADAPAKRGRAARDEAADPVLPEKKRARRRLVGAIALALLVAIGLPMILDSEPKPLASDIDIKIPAKDKAPESAPAASAASGVAASAALDNTEEIVNEPPKSPRPAPDSAPLMLKPSPALAPPPAVADAATPKEAVKETPKARAEAKPEPKAEPEAKVAKVEHKPEPKAESKGELKSEPKAESKGEPKAAEAKPAQSDDDASRALAILEGKPAKAAEPAQKIVLQVAALGSQDKADELLAKLRGAGIKSFTQKSQSGDLIRVRIGPFTSKEEADKAHAKLAKLGLNGSPV